jgi:cell division protein FtsQ
VEQINVSTNSDNEYTITLIPRIGHHTINLGTIDNFENKLARLHTFYEKALPTIGWDKYTTINLEYDGQIICKKTKTK